MTPRRFLADDELDALMDTLPGSDEIPVATLDQLSAANRDMAGMGHGIALAALARGGWAYLGAAPDDAALIRRMVRPRLKMVLAAFSAGVTRLCEHTRQIRPLLLHCDPPTLVCTEPACMTQIDQVAKTTGFRWDNHCDGCGQHAETVAPYLTTLGPLSISGNLCPACGNAVAADAVQAADEIRAVSRKSPCPCGSGRRFKRCHGKASPSVPRT